MSGARIAIGSGHTINAAGGARPEGFEPPNLLIRSQTLYPLSYGRWELRWVTIPPARMRDRPWWATLRDMDQQGAPLITRRDALKAAAGLCGLALVVAGASTAQAAPAPSSAVTTLSDGRVRVRLGKVPSLRQVGGVATIGNVRGVPTAVVRVSNTRYRAIDLRCTHQGATVTETASGWRCPVHFSTFTQTGAKVSGPAAGPLRTVKTRRKRGTLFVG